MPPTVLYVFMGIIVALIGGIAFAYFYIQKKMKNSDVARIEKLRQGTKRKSFNTEVLYQKLYVKYLKTPFVKRYLLKIRRRLEINNIDDEFLTRKQSAKIITRAIVIIIPLTLFVILLTQKSLSSKKSCMQFATLQLFRENVAYIFLINILARFRKFLYLCIVIRKPRINNIKQC